MSIAQPEHHPFHSASAHRRGRELSVASRLWAQVCIAETAAREVCLWRRQPSAHSPQAKVEPTKSIPRRPEGDHDSTPTRPPGRLTASQFRIHTEPTPVTTCRGIRLEVGHGLAPDQPMDGPESSLDRPLPDPISIVRGSFCRLGRLATAPRPMRPSGAEAPSARSRMICQLHFVICCEASSLFSRCSCACSARRG